MSVIRIVTTLLLLLLLLALFAAPTRAGVAAETNLEVLRDAIRVNKKALIAANLDLTDQEAAKFWPVYERYQQELTVVHDCLVTLLQDYTASFRNLTNDHAMKLVEEYLSVEAARVELRRICLGEFAKAVPGKKVARFYQIENKMDAVLRYDLAAEIPVIE